MVRGGGFSRRTYAEPSGWAHPFILAEVERDQRSRVHLCRTGSEPGRGVSAGLRVGGEGQGSGMVESAPHFGPSPFSKPAIWPRICELKCSEAAIGDFTLPERSCLLDDCNGLGATDRLWPKGCVCKLRTPNSQGVLRARSEQTRKHGQFNSLSFQNFVPAAAPPIWRPFLVSV